MLSSSTCRPTRPSTASGSAGLHMVRKQCHRTVQRLSFPAALTKTALMMHAEDSESAAVQSQKGFSFLQHDAC